jgi:hypothetical protein
MRRLSCLVLLLAGSIGAAAAQEPASSRVPVVAVAGCVTQQATTYILRSATEPAPSIANGLPTGEVYKGPTVGPNTFQLIGISEFDMPAHVGHTVLIKGLLIKASPTSRLNVTSVSRLSTSCAPAPK